MIISERKKRRVSMEEKYPSDTFPRFRYHWKDCGYIDDEHDCDCPMEIPLPSFLKDIFK